MTKTIGFVGGQDICAQVTPLVPHECVLQCLSIDEATAAVEAGTLTILIVAFDEPGWRDNVDRLTGLQAAGAARPMSVLALVPRDDPAALVMAFDAGVADCASLPIDPHEVRARLAVLLRRRRVAAIRDAEVRAMWRLARIDPVTGLFNRHHLDTVLPATIDSALSRGRPLAVLMIDLDALKPFNDRWGHAAGDRVLRAVAVALQSEMRTTDVVARYGGDEIVVIMPDTDLLTARSAAARLNAIVAETRIGRMEDGPMGVTVSIGVAMLSETTRDARALLARADSALYKAKRDGRNRVAEAA